MLLRNVVKGCCQGMLSRDVIKGCCQGMLSRDIGVSQTGEILGMKLPGILERIAGSGISLKGVICMCY